MFRQQYRTSAQSHLQHHPESIRNTLPQKMSPQSVWDP